MTLSLQSANRSLSISSVNCTKEILVNFICETNITRRNYSLTSLHSLSKACSPFHMLLNRSCIQLIHSSTTIHQKQKLSDSIKHVVFCSELAAVDIDEIASIILFSTSLMKITFTFPNVPRLSNDKANESCTKVFHCLSKLFPMFQNYQINRSEGFHVSRQNERIISTINNLFSCKKGGHISLGLLCDGNKDCPQDDSDETLCDCDRTRSNFCKNMNKSNIIVEVCGTFFYRSVFNKCLKFIPLSRPLKSKNQLNASCLMAV